MPIGWHVRPCQVVPRGICRTVVPMAIALAMTHASQLRAEEPTTPPRPTHNLFGVTGLIDLPTAEMQPDGQFSLTSGYFGEYLRNTFTVQLFPWLEGSFRYSVLDELFGGTLYDRSLDIKLRLVDEGPGWPALAFGLQDFLGTGIYSGEYIAATKTLLDGDLTATFGLGWGRFAGTNGINNPICSGGGRFCDRSSTTPTGGSVNFGNFFSGEELGFFGGVQWRTPIEDLIFKAEYSDDPYFLEEQSGAFSPEIPFNFGVEYQPLEGVELGAYYLYGAEFGVRLTLSGNPFNPLVDFDDEPAPRPIRPRPAPKTPAADLKFGRIEEIEFATPARASLAEAGIADVSVTTGPNGVRWATASLSPSTNSECPAEAAKAVDAEAGLIDAVIFAAPSGEVRCTVALRPAGQRAIEDEQRKSAEYSTNWYADRDGRRAIVEQLVLLLDADRIGLFGIDLKPEKATLYIENAKFRASPRAIGRTARAMAAVLPPSVETFVIIPVENSLPVVSVTIRRSSLENEVSQHDAARGMWLTAEVTDAERPDWESVDGTLGQFPRPYWSINPAVPVSFFDPDEPLRLDLSVVARGGIEFLPGLSVNGAVSKRIVGNLDDIERESDSVLPRVRSDIALFLEEGDPGIELLTLDYVTKLDRSIYGRASAGLLEGMFGGVSAEVLWQPTRQDWGLGLEVNWAKLRDFDQLFSFQSYNVVTGHVSLYWDTGWQGLSAQIDAGRYLARDWGGTIAMKRRFANGWELGGFATFTNVPFDDFGEGSFDKGIILTIPFGWTLPFETRSEFSTVVRPLTRDGGQRLAISNRLYPTVEDFGRSELRDEWQGFWK